MSLLAVRPTDRSPTGELPGPAPAPEPDPACRLAVVRQFALWPFGSRLLRLHLLLETGEPDEHLNRVLLRAMQQEYFRSEARSQTKAMRSVVLSAHYVLQHRNHDALAHDRVTAAAACSAMRGNTAFVAMAGDAVALAWDGERLRFDRGGARLARPLGGESQPEIRLWSTPLEAGGRLALLCCPRWDDDALSVAERILSSSEPPAGAQAALAEAFAGSAGPAHVLVAAAPAHAERRPRLHASRPPAPAARRGPTGTYPVEQVRPLVAKAGRPGQRSATSRRRPLLLAPLLASLLVLASLAFASPTSRSNPPTLNIRTSGALLAPFAHAGARLADLAVGPDRLYTLDVGQGVVRQYRTDQVGQIGATEILHTGMSVDGQAVEAPVAMTYLPDPTHSTGALAVVDGGRDLLLAFLDGRLVRQPMLGSNWQGLSSLSAEPGGGLLLADGGNGSLLTYPTPSIDQALQSSPLLDRASAPALPFDHIVGILPASDLYVETDDGVVRRFDTSGQELPFAVQPPDAPLGPISGMTGDGQGGLFLADPTRQRIVETGREGQVVRELRTPDVDLDSVRAPQLSLDGSRLYALTDQGVIAIDLPALSEPLDT
ncbi:MAG: hypothetical protein JO023_07130 [Chloroflexi bacterium]|nr:hypothetical protein [Chloroflexota bacterium]